MADISNMFSYYGTFFEFFQTQNYVKIIFNIRSLDFFMKPVIKIYNKHWVIYRVSHGKFSTLKIIKKTLQNQDLLVLIYSMKIRILSFENHIVKVATRYANSFLNNAIDKNSAAQL